MTFSTSAAAVCCATDSASLRSRSAMTCWGSAAASSGVTIVCPIHHEWRPANCREPPTGKASFPKGSERHCSRFCRTLGRETGGAPTSAQGQTETSARRCVRSVLPPEADFGRPHAQVRSVPIAYSCTAATGGSIDHLVVAREHSSFGQPRLPKTLSHQLRV